MSTATTRSVVADGGPEHARVINQAAAGVIAKGTVTAPGSSVDGSITAKQEGLEEMHFRTGGKQKMIISVSPTCTSLHFSRGRGGSSETESIAKRLVSRLVYLWRAI